MPIISNHNKSASSYPQVEKIYNQMSNENATVIDTQWMTPDELDVHVTTALDNNQKVVVMNWWDEMRGDFRRGLYENKDVLVLFNEWVWLKNCEQNFARCTWDEVQPQSFDNTYLCYMNKVKPWRQDLYNVLSKHQGILSLGTKKHFKETITYTTGMESDLVAVVDELPPTVDVYSLGDLSPWNKHFLNIVSEGLHGTYYPVWITEKTFKPIIGSRPFIIYGHPETAQRLQSVGFETFDEEFEHNPHTDFTVHANLIGDIINNVKKENLESWYEKLIPKIKHNFENWRSYAIIQHEKAMNQVKEFLC